MISDARTRTVGAAVAEADRRYRTDDVPRLFGRPCRLYNKEGTHIGRQPPHDFGTGPTRAARARAGILPDLAGLGPPASAQTPLLPSTPGAKTLALHPLRLSPPVLFCQPPAAPPVAPPRSPAPTLPPPRAACRGGVFYPPRHPAPLPPRIAPPARCGRTP